MAECVFKELRGHLDYLMTFKLPKGLTDKDLEKLDNPEVLSYQEIVGIEARLIQDL